MKGETLGEGKNWTKRQGRERPVSLVEPAARPSTLRSTLLKENLKTCTLIYHLPCVVFRTWLTIRVHGLEGRHRGGEARKE